MTENTVVPGTDDAAATAWYALAPEEVSKRLASTLPRASPRRRPPSC